MTEYPQEDITAALYSIAETLRTIANEGLQYQKSEYDKQRYEKVLVSSTHLYRILDQNNIHNILTDFIDNSDQFSPLLGAEAAVFHKNKLLLIKRHDDGLWAVPGGRVDKGETLKEAALRELKEETGIDGTIVRLLGIFDSRRWKSKLKSQLFHVIFEVTAENCIPHTTQEALDCEYYGPSDLPELSPGHDIRVPFLFRLHKGEIRVPYID